MSTGLLSSGTSKIENVNDIGLVWISGNSTEDETLTATVSDEDGYLSTSVTYKWYRSGTSVVVGTGSTYRLTQSDVDSTLLVSVSYEDSYGTVYTGLLSSATSKIENVNDIGLVWISGNSTEDETLTANVNDEDGYLSTSVTYKWYRSGTSGVVGTESTYRLTQSDVDSTLLVSVSYEDSYGTVYTDLLSSGTSKIENVNDIGLVWISGNSTEDETLTATVSDEDGYLSTSVTYKWYRSGTSGVVGTGSTYRLTQSDVDSTLLVSVSYEDSYGTVYTGLLSSATSKIENVNDIGLVWISGNSTEDETLTANVSDEDGTSNSVFSYKWYRSGTSTVVGISSQYVLTQLDVGSTIIVLVSYRDDQGWNYSDFPSSSIGPIVENLNDYHPTPFSFSSVLGVSRSTTIESNQVVAADINVPTLVTIESGEYKVNNGLYTADSTLINNGTTLQVRHRSSDGYSKRTTSILTVGSFNSKFVSITEVDPLSDNVPDIFSFKVRAGVTTGTEVESEIIVISGITTITEVRVENGEYKIGTTGIYTTQAGVLNNGDVVQVRHQSASSYQTEMESLVTIGTVSAKFISITKSSIIATVSSISIGYQFAESSSRIIEASLLTTQLLTIGYRTEPSTQLSSFLLRMYYESGKIISFESTNIESEAFDSEIIGQSDSNNEDTTEETDTFSIYWWNTGGVFNTNPPQTWPAGYRNEINLLSIEVLLASTFTGMTEITMQGRDRVYRGSGSNRIDFLPKTPQITILDSTLINHSTFVQTVELLNNIEDILPGTSTKDQTVLSAWTTSEVSKAYDYQQQVVFLLNQLDVSEVGSEPVERLLNRFYRYASLIALGNKVPENVLVYGLSSSLTVGGTDSFSAVATDPESSELSWTVASVENGSIIIVGSSIGESIELRYIANNVFVGIDNFILQVEDKIGGVETISYSVRIENQKPIFIASSVEVIVREDIGNNQQDSSYVPVQKTGMDISCSIV